jgi:hypothetical protein
MPVIALALRSRWLRNIPKPMLLERGTVIDMTLNIALTGHGSWILRTKAITLGESGGWNTAG